MNLLLAQAETAAQAPAGQQPRHASHLDDRGFCGFLDNDGYAPAETAKKREAMLNALKKGDKVITIGGIHGEITKIDGDDILLRVADKVELKMLRSAVSRVKGE